MNKDSHPTVSSIDSTGEGNKSSPPTNSLNTPSSSTPDSNMSNVLRVLSNSGSGNDDSNGRRSFNNTESQSMNNSPFILTPNNIQQVLQNLQNQMQNDKRNPSGMNPIETARMLVTMSRNNSPSQVLPSLTSSPANSFSPSSSSSSSEGSPSSNNANDSEERRRKQLKHDKRRRVTKACVYCQRSHMSCDAERPCKRCIERGISDMCTDGETKRRGRKRVYIQEGEFANSTPSSSQIETLSQQLVSQYPNYNVSPDTIQAALSQVPPKQEPQPPKRPKVEDVNFLEFSNSLFQNFNSPNSNSPFSSQNAVVQIQNQNQNQNNDWESLNLDLSHMREQKSFMTKYNDEETNLESPSTTTNLQNLQGFCEALRRRLASDDSEMIAKKIMLIRNQILQLKQNLKTETVDLTKRDFDVYLGVFRNTFEQLAIPTLIWERMGVIHYANPAYQTLTGFRAKTPTDPDSFVLLVELSAIGVRHYLSRLLTVFMETTTNSFMFPAGVLAHDISKPEHLIYIEGTMCVTIKRDVIGLPLLFIGNFLPRSV